MLIRRLAANDVREGFSSGEPDTDRFLRLYALQNQRRHGVGVTYVAAEHDLVLGFVTVAAGSLEADDPMPPPTRGPRYPLPILRIARLGVDSRVQRRGLGSELVGFALGLAVKQRESVGCALVLVDALPASEKFYARLGFVSVAESLLEGGSGVRPRPVTMVLATATIASRR